MDTWVLTSNSVVLLTDTLKHCAPTHTHTSQQVGDKTVTT